jgi:hypothetical protein
MNRIPRPPPSPKKGMCGGGGGAIRFLPPNRRGNQTDPDFKDEE